MDYALTLSHVSKKYQDFQLQDVNLQLERGTIMGFIGENGAGKSTTINAILGLIRTDGGEITVLGEKSTDTPAHQELKERIGVVIDEACFPEMLRLKDIRSIVSRIYRTWDMKKFHTLCEKFALPENKPIKDFSKGTKTKLMIAIALSHATELLILDEATSGLDPVVRDEVLDIFLEFIEDPSHSIFMSSHILSDLEKVCDYITFIHKGKILLSQPKDELIDSFCVMKCSEEKFRELDSKKIYGFRRNKFGVETLVKRNSFPEIDAPRDRVSIEDIMLYLVKEN